MQRSVNYLRTNVKKNGNLHNIKGSLKGKKEEKCARTGLNIHVCLKVVRECYFSGDFS